MSLIGVHGRRDILGLGVHGYLGSGAATKANICYGVFCVVS